MFYIVYWTSLWKYVNFQVERQPWYYYDVYIYISPKTRAPGTYALCIYIYMYTSIKTVLGMYLYNYKNVSLYIYIYMCGCMWVCMYVWI